MAWVMPRAGPPADPTCTNRASRTTSSASCITSSGIVAEKSSVWRVGAVRQRVDDPADVGPEAHVHHPVRLVEHQRVELRRSHRAVAHVIHQPAGRGDDDVDAGLEGAFLRIHRHAAVDGDAGQVGVVGEALDVVFDLAGQLAGRGQDEDPGEAAFLRGRLARPQHPVEDRQQERRRLAGAGVGAADQIVPVQRRSGSPRSGWAWSARSRESRMPSSSDGPRPSVSNATGLGSYSAWGRWTGGRGVERGLVSGAPALGRGLPTRTPSPARVDEGLYGNSN